jgi:tetratricopeptide (TPR) repeat protein
MQKELVSNKKRFLIIQKCTLLLITIWLSVVISFAFANEIIYIQTGDEYFNNQKYLDAIKEYKKVLDINPNNDEVLWRIGRAYNEIGEDASKEERLAYHEKAVKYCQRAIVLNPQSIEGHFELSRSLGQLALFKGPLKSLYLGSKIKKEAEIVLKLDYTHDGAHHILGIWYREAPWFIGGNKRKAVREFKLAIKYNPKFILHHLELGKTYLKMKEYKLAYEELRKVLELSNIIPEDADNKEEAKKLLNEIKNKLVSDKQ